MDRDRTTQIIDFLCGSTSAIIAETVTHPLDSAKTRLQMQFIRFRFRLHAEVSPAKDGHPVTLQYRGVTRTIIGITKEEGMRSLFKGLPPAILRQCVKGGTQMSIYKIVRKVLNDMNPDVQFTSLPQKVLAAAAAGAIGQFLGNPFDVVKVRLQMDGKRVLVGKQPRYAGTFDAFRVIFTKNGLFSFWNGVLPAMGRSAVSSGSGLATYDHIKEMLVSNFKLPDASTTHLMASALSSLSSTFFGCPFDVIKTRIMEQSMMRPLYRNGVHCLIKTMHGEGLLGLYRGFIPTYFRIGPWQALFFLSYENLTRYLIGETL